MNEKHTQMLYEYCDFAIYRIKDHIDDDKIESYLSELNNRTLQKKKLLLLSL